MKQSNSVCMQKAFEFARITDSDAESWLNSRPVRGRTNYSLLFDRNFSPKSALYSVIETGMK